jgi:hypothetical protein
VAALASSAVELADLEVAALADLEVEAGSEVAAAAGSEVAAVEKEGAALRHRCWKRPPLRS